MTEIEITALNADGEGVGRLGDGRVVFVPGSLPGDRAQIELKPQKKKSVLRGALLELTTPSSQRAESICRVQACGGCALKSLEISAQRASKRQRVIETLRRIGKIQVDPESLEVQPSPQSWHYRHRVRLHTEWLDGHWECGFYGAKSRRLVPFTECPVLWPELNQACLGVAEALHHVPRSAALQDFEIAFSRWDGRAAGHLETAIDTDFFRSHPDWTDQACLSGLEVQGPTTRWRHGNLELRYDHRRVEDYGLKYEPGVFTQANPAANDLLIDEVLKSIRPFPNAKVLELHAGVGNLTLPLTFTGAEVTATEVQSRASILCARNVRNAGRAAQIFDQKDETMLEHFSSPQSFDAIVLDPPRTGAREAIDRIAQTKIAARVVYISCDPATLARDGARLYKENYELTALSALDLFPQTPHVEIVAIFDLP